jgi:hypothetical protein
MKRLTRFALVFALAAFVLPAQEKVDLDAIYKIKQEAFQNSKVMDDLFWLTDVYGPKISGSPVYKQAADWCVKTLKENGIDAKLEKWGPFGKGWQNERLSVHMLEPTYQPLIAAVSAWTESTPGPVTGQPILAVINTEEDLAKWKGKLKGKIVFTSGPVEVPLHTTPGSTRYSDQELANIFMAPSPGDSPFRRMQSPGQPNYMQIYALRKKLAAFLREEGPAAVVNGSARGNLGTVFASGGGSRDAKEALAPPTITLTAEHYNRIARLLQKEVPVKLEIEIKNSQFPENADTWNVVGEIPGGRKKDEVVLIGGHLDSWHYGTGAADNAIGVSIMMEVMRVLKKLDFKMDRTVRVGLWAAEEQGLLGSRAYVSEHLGDRDTMKTTKAWEKFSAYYNIDNGGGKIRGIYLQGNEAARPVMEALLAPFKDLGVTTVTSRNTSGTDHQSFDAVGLPAFQFIQDTLEYDTLTHHSNMDVFERLQRGDTMQMVAVVASMVYHTANRPEMIPRKPKPAAGSAPRMPF